MKNDWEETKKTLKQQATEAFSKLKNFALRYGLYATAALTMTGSALSSEYQQSLQNGNERLQNRLDANEKNDKDIAMAWDAALSIGDQKDIFSSTEQKAEQLYETVKGPQMDEFVSIQSLMDKAGVKMADIQAAVNKNPELLFDVKPGDTAESLARAANRVTGKASGSCTLGVQKIFAAAGMGALLDGANGMWPEKFKEAKGSNSGCNAYIPLEKSEKFITVSLDNKAYQRYGGGSSHTEAAEAMGSFAERLPAGTVLSIDNKLDDYSGRRLPQDNAGIVHGHTCVKPKKQGYACDGWQIRGPNFARYGAKVHASIAVDSSVNKDFALEIIKAAERRREQENKLEIQATQKRLWGAVRG